MRIAAMGASTIQGCSYCILRGLPWYTSVYGSILSFQRENPSRRTDAVVGLALKLLTMGGRIRTLPIPGGKILIPAQNIVGIMISIYEVFIQKEYERYRDYLPARGDTVVDVGAFIGLWTIHASRKVGERGRVIAFEPNPFVFSQLEENVSLNGLKNVTLLRSALGDHVGQVEIYGEAKESSLASMYRDRVELYVSEEKIAAMTTEMTTIDILLEGGVKAIDLLKIDAEGAELAILNGASKSLESGSIRRAIVEVHQDRCSNQEVADLMLRCGLAVDHNLNDPDPRTKKGFVFSSSRR